VRELLYIALTAYVATTIGAHAFDPGDADQGEKNFRQCQACHMVGPQAKNRTGPILNGIVGRPVASEPGFNYGKGIKTFAEGGKVWDEDMIFEYLKDPSAFIGGPSKMAMKFPDETFRRDVVTYLAQIGADGQRTQ